MVGGDIRGVHLLFHTRLSQFGLTYWTEFYWTRKVPVTIPNETTRETAEFVFTFGFPGHVPRILRLHRRHGHARDVIQLAQWA